MSNRLTYTQILKTKEGKRYYKPLKYPIIPLSINDLYVVTTTGDRLDLLANQFYRNPDYWWIIATANPDVIRRDSFNLKPSLELRIPADYQNVVKLFEELNQ